jgi:hypothetical protein
METKNKAWLALVLVSLIVGGCIVNKAAGAFKTFQQAQTAQLAGF